MNDGSVALSIYRISDFLFIDFITNKGEIYTLFKLTDEEKIPATFLKMSLGIGKYDMYSKNAITLWNDLQDEGWHDRLEIPSDI
jgi:hypothetical protein